MVKTTDYLSVIDILKKPFYYNQLIASSASRFLPLFIPMMPADARILDVGCGSSNVIPAGYNIVRCDVNPDYSPDVLCSALQLPFENESFDCVVHSWVLEHLEEPAKAIEESYRVLKPDALLYLTTNMAWHIHEEPRDFFRFTEYGLRYIFAKSHCDILFIKATLGFWGTVTQLIAYKTAALLSAVRLRWIHPLFTVPLQTMGLLFERKGGDTSLCAGYCVIARKL